LPGLGGTNTTARAINDFGQIVGESNAPGTVFHAFLLQTDNTIVDLSGGLFSKALAINTKGTVVGTFNNAQNQTHAFVWKPTTDNAATGAMTDLNTLIPANTGWVLTSANGVNDKGWIVGRGLLNGN